MCLTLVSNALTQQQIDSVAIDVKSQLGLNKDISRYSKDTIVADVSDTMDNFNTVHKYGDCFISLDAGYAWPIHVLDAYAFGSSVIASDIGGNKDVVAPISAPILQIVPLPVQEMDEAPSPKY